MPNLRYTSKTFTENLNSHRTSFANVLCLLLFTTRKFILDMVYLCNLGSQKTELFFCLYVCCRCGACCSSSVVRPIFCLKLLLLTFSTRTRCIKYWQIISTQKLSKYYSRDNWNQRTTANITFPGNWNQRTDFAGNWNQRTKLTFSTRTRCIKYCQILSAENVFQILLLLTGIRYV